MGSAAFEDTFWMAYGLSAIAGLVIAAFLAFIPARIARAKGKSFGLWWFYGWTLFIVALIHALLLETDSTAQAIAEGGKKCPYCAEIVKPDAIVCRFCGRDLPQDLKSVVEQDPEVAQRYGSASQTSPASVLIPAALGALLFVILQIVLAGFYWSQSGTEPWRLTFWLFGQFSEPGLDGLIAGVSPVLAAFMFTFYGSLGRRGRLVLAAMAAVCVLAASNGAFALYLIMLFGLAALLGPRFGPRSVRSADGLRWDGSRTNAITGPAIWGATVLTLYYVWPVIWALLDSGSLPKSDIGLFRSLSLAVFQLLPGVAYAACLSFALPKYWPAGQEDAPDGAESVLANA